MTEVYYTALILIDDQSSELHPIANESTSKEDIPEEPKNEEMRDYDPQGKFRNQQFKKGAGRPKLIREREVNRPQN